MGLLYLYLLPTVYTGDGAETALANIYRYVAVRYNKYRVSVEAGTANTMLCYRLHRCGV
jgi:hypothetical protein